MNKENYLCQKRFSWSNNWSNIAITFGDESWIFQCSSRLSWFSFRLSFRAIFSITFLIGSYIWRWNRVIRLPFPLFSKCVGGKVQNDSLIRLESFMDEFLVFCFEKFLIFLPIFVFSNEIYFISHLQLNSLALLEIFLSCSWMFYLDFYATTRNERWSKWFFQVFLVKLMKIGWLGNILRAQFTIIKNC